MISRRARRAAIRFWFSVTLLAALSLAPLAPAFAWTPPPKPLPTEPVDTDGRDDSLHDDRPSHSGDSGDLGETQTRQSATVPSGDGFSDFLSSWIAESCRMLSRLFGHK